MKKIFVNPEVNTVELSPMNRVMAYDMLVSYDQQQGETAYNLFDNEVSAEYTKWKGLK